MSTEVKVSEETLASLFLESAPVLEFEKGLTSQNIKLSKDFSDSLSPHVISNIGTSRSHLTILSKLNPSLGTKQIQNTLKISMNDSNSTFTEITNWFSNIFKNAKDKLRELAQMIFDRAKKTGIAISEYLERMRQAMFKWVLRNSVVASFDIGDSTGTKKTFTPTKISTEGSFSYGSIDKSISSVDDILGFLKVIPSVGIKISVEYGFE